MEGARRRMVCWLLAAATAFAAALSGDPASAQGPPLPTPRVAIDFEYASLNGGWNAPGFALSGAGSCAQQSSDGAWDAGNGYAGIVLDLGDPLGLQAHAGSLAGAESALKASETCFAQGFASVAPHAEPVIYVGFSNCVPSAGASGQCGARAPSLAGYRRAGTIAAAYVATGTADVAGAWVDIESDWSTVGALHQEVVGYLSGSPAKAGHGQWCDSSYRNFAPGLPNSTWTTTAMASQYVSPLLQAGYTCLGTQRILIPQVYVASWLTDGAANFSPASPLAAYVGGITVCGAAASVGRCPDLGIPAGGGQPTKWYDYEHDGYANAGSGVLAVVGGGLLKLRL